VTLHICVTRNAFYDFFATGNTEIISTKENYSSNWMCKPAAAMESKKLRQWNMRTSRSAKIIKVYSYVFDESPPHHTTIYKNNKYRPIRYMNEFYI